MRNILIIDNSSVVRDIIKNLFINSKNLLTFQAKSIQEAEELIKNNNFFVVISNRVLPYSSDFEIQKILAKNNLPTIIFSSTIESKLIAEKKNSNIVDYVLKDANGFKYIYRLVSAMVYCHHQEVLVVDDSISISLHIKEILQKLLFKVSIVKDGNKALEEIKRNKNFSLILSDLDMPNMNGFELTKKLRADNIYVDVPIIIITSKVDHDLKVNLYKYGTNDIILKPILQEELISKVINIFLNLKQIEEISKFNKIIDEYIITSSTDITGKIVSASKAFCKISGYSEKELLGKNHNILRHPDTPASVFRDLWKTISSGKVWKGEIKNLKKNKEFYWVDVIVEPIFFKDGTIIGYNSIRHDITDKKLIEIISITDGLTDIYNRRYFNETFPKIIASAKRKNELVCFLLMDIDHFKQYNDNYGHQMGDDVLINFAKCLKQSLLRANDLVFRLGGEEFGIIYSSETKEKAIDFANKIRQNIENLKIKHDYNSVNPYITASMGLICKNANDIDDNIYKDADELLYASKRNGRNQVKVNI